MEERDKENIPKRDRIDALIERKKTNITSLVEKKKTDPTYITKVQGQLTTVNNKLTDLNHRYNLLEQKNKQLEEKCQKLTESNRNLSENFEIKEKDLRGLTTKLTYALKEKQTFEGKLKESKGYINKLEQRILQNPKGTSQTNQTTDYNTGGTTETDDNGKGYDNIELLQMIENQKYEIKLLTQALHEKELRSNDTRERSYSSNPNNIEKSHGLRDERVDRRVFDRLKENYEALSNQFEDLQTELFQLREKGYKNERGYQEDGSYQQLSREMNSLKNEKEEIENEKNSLHQYVEDLNQKISLLTNENIRMQKGQEEIHSRSFGDQTKLRHDMELKDLEIKRLNNALNQERQKIAEMEEKFERGIEHRRMLFEEREKSRQMDEINQMLRQEIDKLKNLMKEYETEVEYYKEETERLKKDKDNLRAGLEEFIKRNSTIEQSLNIGKNANSSDLHTSKMLDELEQVEIEKKRLKESLSQTLNELNSYKEREREFDDTLKKKESQIENLMNSKTKMQNTLGDQVLIKEKENKRLKDEFAKCREDLEAMREENKFIRDLLRKQEKYMNEYSISDQSKY